MIKALIFFFSIITTASFAQTKSMQDPLNFIPKNFVLFEKIHGDLNKDGAEDCVLIIKATDKSQVIEDEYRGMLDRNRRGIIVLLNKNNTYELAVKNYTCFSSENEYGGGYFAPELSVEIKNGNLTLNYGHGRYGYWKYTFRYQNQDLALIGYDAGYRSEFVSDWVTFDQESINFLTKKKVIKEVNKVSADGEEYFKETWKNLSVPKLLNLSAIKDFDELNEDKLYQEK